MGATWRPPFLFPTIVTVLALLAGGLVAWAAAPPRRPRRPASRPTARPRPPATRPLRPNPRLHPPRPKPIVRVLPRATPVVVYDTQPDETVTVVREVTALPPTAMVKDDADTAAPRAWPVTGLGEGLSVTVKVDGKETPVRLIGVAVPKVAGLETSRAEATTRGFLRNLLAGEFVYLVADKGLETQDEAGHRVAYLYRAPDEMLVNLELIRQGYAVAPDGYPFEHADAFRVYQRRARADARGLWGLLADAPQAKPAAEQVARDDAGE